MDIPAPLIQSLDSESGVSLVLDAQGIIRFLNSAWTTHAQIDDADWLTPEFVLHKSYLSFVDGPLREVIAEIISRALQRQGPPLLLEGECNTPEFFRLLTSTFSAIADEKGAVVACVVRHSVRVGGPLGDRYVLSERPPEAFRNPSTGFIIQCSYCRRLRDPQTGSWEMSSEAVRRTPEMTSHGLCDPCGETYFPSQVG
jgi:hypothetical protein